MSAEDESDDGNGVWSTVITVVILAVVAAGFLPIWSSKAKVSPLTANLSNAKQVAVALKMYAGDNDDQLPQSLEALVPAYCPSNAVLLNNVADGKTKVPWQYFPGHKSDEEPPVIVIQSPKTPIGGWVAGYSDGSARIIYKADADSRK